MLVRKVLLYTLFIGLVKNTVGLGPIVAGLAKNYILSELKDLIKNVDQNNTCVRHLFRVANGVQNKEMWALRVVDSFSKINPGLLDGNIVNQGSFDECLSVNDEGNDFRGQYCSYVVQADLPVDKSLKKFDKEHNHVENLKISRMMNVTRIPIVGAVCVPDICTAEDLNTIFRQSNLSAKYPNVTIGFHDILCAKNKTWFENWSWLKWFGLSYFLFHLALMLLSTAYDCVRMLLQKKPLHNILLIYSVPYNLKKLFTVKESSGDEIRCIQGLRAISMAWVILGHRFMAAMFHPNMNALYVVQDWFTSKSSSIIFAAHLSVDTFFFISGVLVFYIYFLAQSKGVKFNIIGYYIHRYIRLTPSVAALIIFVISFYEDFGNGPFFKIVLDNFYSPCYKNWWKTLLYIQNLQQNDEMCLGHTWYLGADTQLYVIAPIFFLTMLRWPKAVLGMMGAVIGICAGLNFWKSWDQKLIVSVLAIENPKAWVVYAQTQYRAAIWFIGAILGYYLFKTKDVIIRIPKWVVILLWTVTICMQGFLVYSSYILMEHPEQRELHAFSFGFLRVFWGLGLCWIVFACFHGLGGFINTFLSNSFFVVIGRLTFSIYVVHVTVIFITYFTERTNSYFSSLRSVHDFWGDCVNCTLFGILWNLAFEAPLRNFSNILIHRSVTQTTTKPDANGNRKEI